MAIQTQWLNSLLYSRYARCGLAWLLHTTASAQQEVLSIALPVVCRESAGSLLNAVASDADTSS